MQPQGSTPCELKEHTPTAENLAWWRAHVPSDWGVEPDCILEGTPSRQEDVSIFTMKHRQTVGPHASRLRYGWPLISMERSIWTSATDVVTAQDYLVLRLPVYSEVPLRPVCPGFVINTLFYALILSGVFALPVVLRRKRRLKRGLCVKCAYPVGKGGTSDVCTECGTPHHNAAKSNRDHS